MPAALATTSVIASTAGEAWGASPTAAAASETSVSASAEQSIEAPPGECCRRGPREPRTPKVRPAVGGRVRDGRDRQGKGVGSRASRAPRAAGGRAGHTRASTRARPRRSAPPGAPQQPRDARAGRRARSCDDVDARVGVVDPVDRHLVDAQAVALGQHEQLGVEEPALVLDSRQQLARDVGADRLEAALRVGEAGAQRRAQEQVVASARSARASARATTREPGASRVPIATSLWPETSGATSGSSAARSVERSTSM